MVEFLALALIKAVISAMVHQGVQDLREVRAESLPKWYGENRAKEICESTFSTGNPPDALDNAVAQAKSRLHQRLSEATRSAAEARIRETRDDEERAILQAFSRDDQAGRFVAGAALMRDHIYKAGDKQTAYARVCIPEGAIETYQHTRIVSLSKSISLHRRGKAEQELEAEVGAGGTAEQPARKTVE